MSGSESPTFVCAVLRDQAIGSAMRNACASQEKRAGGHERNTSAVRVIFTQTESQDWYKCVHGRNKYQHIMSF